MDPFTHAIVGVGVGALSGQTLSPYNPIYCAAVFGAVAPDLDVITKLKGDYSFLRHHRGISHSLSGILLISAAIAGIVYVDFGGSLWLYFLWAVIGALSHVTLDFFNSYGATLWWPLSSKKRTGNLLMFMDPVLLLFFVPVFVAYQKPRLAAVVSLILFAAYLVLRWKMRLQVENFLKKHFNLKSHTEKLAVMPALRGIASWDFLIDSPLQVTRGTMHYFGQQINSILFLDKKTLTPLTLKALQTAPGRFFQQFTSFYHIDQWEEKGKTFVKLMDLRFGNKSDFFYKLTMVFNKQWRLEKASIYRLNDIIPLNIGRDIPFHTPLPGGSNRKLQ